MYTPLKKQLAQKGKSLYWLSRESNVSYPTCWRIMHGKVEPTLATLRKFAEALRCDVTDLIERMARKTESN